MKLQYIKYLQECINRKITIHDNLYSFIIIYRSSQTHDEFVTFIKNFELNLYQINEKNYFLTFVLADFNDKSQVWFKYDKTLYEWFKLDILTCSLRLHQLIKDPTHLLDSSSFCID